MNCPLCDYVNVKETPTFGWEEISCPVCGNYKISLVLQNIGLLNTQYADTRHLISAATRQASNSGTPLTLKSDNLDSVLDTLPKLVTPLDILDRLVLWLGKHQTRSDKGIVLDPRGDYPLAFAHDAFELKHFLKILTEQGLIVSNWDMDKASVFLTPRGWERVIELRKISPDFNQAFVAMNFSPDLDEAWEKGFRPALKSTGFDPYRVDRDQFNDKIDDHIVSEIRRSGLLVADFTGHRNGVYFEAGFAMGLGIPVIWTCRKDEIGGAHFDTRQYNHITWADLGELKTSLALRIAATIPGRRIQSD